MRREEISNNLNEQTWAKNAGIKTQAEQFGEQQRQTLREKAQLDAQLLEKRYTAKDKAAMAKIETEAKAAYSAYMNGEISAEDLQNVQNLKQRQKMGIIPGMLPSLSPYEKGKGVGDVWEANGFTWSRKENGELWQPDEKRSLRGIQMEQEAKAVEAKARLDNERWKAQEKFKDDLMKGKVTDPGTGDERSYTPAEMKKMMEQRFPSTEMPNADKVEKAKNYMQSVIARYGETPPEEELWMIEQAQDIIRTSEERAW
jgi:hypothetical protein